MSIKDILWLIIVVLAVSTILFHVANAEVHHEDRNEDGSCTGSLLAVVENCGEEPVKPAPIPSPGPAPNVPRVKIARTS
jgi:hypothetical protein